MMYCQYTFMIKKINIEQILYKLKKNEKNKNNT